MKDFGESLIGLGIMGCIFFWFIYDPTVSMPSNPYFNGRVVNLHRSQTQTRGIMISIGAAVVGAILMVSAKPSNGDEPFSENDSARNNTISSAPTQRPNTSKPISSTKPLNKAQPQQNFGEGKLASRVTRPPPPPPRRKS